MELEDWLKILPWIIIAIPTLFIGYYGIRAWRNPAFKRSFLAFTYQFVSFFGFIIIPLKFFFKKIRDVFLYLFPLHIIERFSDYFGLDPKKPHAWSSKNLFTTMVISFVTIFAIVLYSWYSTQQGALQEGEVMNPQLNTFAIIAFSFLVMCVLYVFYIFGKGKYDKKNPENIFPSEGTFREQATWTLKRSATFMKSLILLIIILGVLGGMLWFAMTSPENAEWIASTLMVLTGIVILTIVYFGIKDLEIIKKLMKNKILQFIFHLIFLIPCLIFEVVNYIYNELKYTPQYIYNILIFEIIFIALYFVYPIIKDKLYVFLPFADDNTEVKKAELKTISLSKLQLKKEISEEKKKLTKKYTMLDDYSFFQKIKKNSLTVKEKEDELENHIISYLCPACGPTQRDPTKPLVDNTIYKTTNKQKINDVKAILVGRNYKGGLIEKIALLEARMADLDDKEKSLEQQIKDGDGGLETKVIQMKSVYLGEKNKIANYKDLRKGGKMVIDDIKYNYAISFWFFLHSNAPNFYKKNRFYEILNYSDKPRISYNPSKNELVVIMNDGDAEHKRIRSYKIKDIKLQRWNNLVINYVNGALDIFLDKELVATLPQTIPANTADNLTIGDDNGINGGICNIVFYGNRLTKRRIEMNYELLKNKNPPVL